MRCHELESCLEDWLDGKENPALADHLRTCRRCRALAEEMQQLTLLLALLRQEPVMPEAAFWVRLRERMELAERGQEAFWVAFNQLAGRTAAVLAAILLVLGLLTLRQPQPASIAGIEMVQEASLLPNGEMTSDQVLLSLATTEPEQ